MPQDTRRALTNVAFPLAALTITPRTATAGGQPARGKIVVGMPVENWSHDRQDETVDYIEGIFDNRPDKPGQSAIRKKTFEYPIEFLLPGKYVKSISELVAGADTPPGVHREDGGRGTGGSERRALAEDAARRKAEADAAQRQRQWRFPPGTIVQVVPRPGFSAPEAIALGAYQAGIKGSLSAHESDGRALELSALASRVLAPGVRSPSLSKSATGHAIVHRLGLLQRRLIRSVPTVGRGNALFDTGNEIEVEALVNIEGVDP